jgi:2-C-methyl-D-erythritol 4-phosphate cytidylyltransferase
VTTACIVPAAGRGARLGPGTPKALRLLAGEPLLVHAGRSAVASGVVDLVAVAAPPSEADDVRDLLKPHAPELVVVAGGATRKASVATALAEVPAAADVVLVHDAARCLAPPELFAAVTSAVRRGADAAVPVVPVTDTVKQVHGDKVLATLDRSELYTVQTPQAFRRAVLDHAHATVDEDATDDAGLAERAGAVVRVVAGDDEAFKITRPLDLLLAEIVLSRRGAGA